MARVEEKVADGSVLELIRTFLEARIMDGLESWTPAAGAPQGAVLSPLLSNIYLNPLDHLMAERGFQMVRSADDFVILCRTREDAQRALDLVPDWVTENGLTRHPTKTQIVDSREAGFGFLACLSSLADRQFQGARRTPREKSLRTLKDTLRAKTRRTSGDSLSFVINNVNQTRRGWFADFQHIHPPWSFERLDPWVRLRWRSILRKRAGRHGRGRGDDHHRWPNRFFVGQGLFSLKTAPAQAVQSCPR